MNHLNAQVAAPLVMNNDDDDGDDDDGDDDDDDGGGGDYEARKRGTKLNTGKMISLGEAKEVWIRMGPVASTKAGPGTILCRVIPGSPRAIS